MTKDSEEFPSVCGFSTVLSSNPKEQVVRAHVRKMVRCTALFVYTLAVNSQTLCAFSGRSARVMDAGINSLHSSIFYYAYPDISPMKRFLVIFISSLTILLSCTRPSSCVVCDEPNKDGCFVGRWDMDESGNISRMTCDSALVDLASGETGITWGGGGPWATQGDTLLILDVATQNFHYEFLDEATVVLTKYDRIKDFPGGEIYLVLTDTEYMWTRVE